MSIIEIYEIIFQTKIEYDIFLTIHCLDQVRSSRKDSDFNDLTQLEKDKTSYNFCTVAIL